ncbi:chemotaxis protein CheW [Psychromonas sp. B3M02]|uniref:chemotaxis protein CheW n=1 Tax=Psychromonas sp. B3M02 TaxID=2267226 RepID=UPI000DEA4EAF|nr:chemotaxis protein CheW [Psychromonas sp. B3M02]RBW47445.1 chemotaxis protein CheW [Psychromonas sp. B3M02]
MKNNNNEAMKNYFDSMLRDDQTAEVPVSKETEFAEPVHVDISTLPKNLVFSETDVAVEKATQQNQQAEQEEWQNLQVEDNFQVLFFELNQVTFAIPLTDLGGIYQLSDSLNFLMGKPAWFRGVMSHNERLYNIVDTATWLQLGKNAQDLQYTHFILLGSTAWGLSCEKLLGTESLNKDQIRWRDKKGSRPWLAGMVKQKMCALIHAEELVKLLSQGMDIRS